MTTLKAEKRSMSIKAKRLRREGFVTGNIFGREIPESIPVKMERTVAERLLKTCNKGSQILLDVDGQVFDVLIKDICFNSMKGLVEEIDFQALVSGGKSPNPFPLKWREPWRNGSSKPATKAARFC